MSVDVLNLEWTTAPSRDRAMATLVCNYLRLQGSRVEEQSVFDGYQALNKSKPRLLFMTNTTGAQVNLDLMQYAKSRGCLGLSLISEGNFIRDSANHLEMLWGWNKQKILAEDRYLLWSERCRTIALQLHPELVGRVRVSGGVGFDNYRIGKPKTNRENFLSQWGKAGYKKIIGIGCFDFGTMYPEDYRYPINVKSFSEVEIQRFRNDGLGFDQILSAAASARPDILFLAKQHPGQMLGHKASGTMEISKLPNVLILKDELSIFECIALSDFWIVYESTTALEAWLLGKQTCLLNPSGRNFPRDMVVSEGSPAYVNVQQLTEAIHGFYEYKALPGFFERDAARRENIKQTIQCDDGLNHVRAGNEIIELLENSTRSNWVGEKVIEKIERWKQHLKWQLGPYLRQTATSRGSHANRANFSNAALKEYQKNQMREQEAFYSASGFSLADLREIRCQ